MTFSASNFANAVQDEIQYLVNCSTDPMNQIRTFVNVFNGLTADTSLVADLIRCTVLAQILISVSNVTLISSNDAQKLLDQLLPLFDAELYLCTSSLAFNDIKTLRSKLSADLIARGLKLPSVLTIKNKKPLPALVVAWNQYADCTRQLQLCQMNNITDPNFSPLVLQVLSS